MIAEPHDVADASDASDASDATDADPTAGAPYLPPAVRPTPAQPLVSAVSAPALTGELHTSPTSRGPVVSDAPPAIAFDAKAMVAAQKHFTASPVYGAIPKPTAESLAAAEALRTEARRIRRRNKTLGWSIAVALIGGFSAAGLLAFRAYQSDQDRDAAARAERAAARDAAEQAGELPGALTPLGAQDQVVDLLGDLNSGGAAPSAGGLLDAVGDARRAVDDIEQKPIDEAGSDGSATDDSASASTVLAVVDVALVEPIMLRGFRLDDLDGFERYVIDARRWAADSPVTYSKFVAAMQQLPQSEAESTAFAVLPPLQATEIGLAVRHDHSRVDEAVIVSTNPEIHVITTP